MLFLMWLGSIVQASIVSPMVISDPQLLTLWKTNVSYDVASPDSSTTTPGTSFPLGSSQPLPVLDPAAAQNEIAIQCSAEDYGSPPPASCRAAYAELPATIQPETFGDRSAGTDWNVTLPFRFISHKQTIP